MDSLDSIPSTLHPFISLPLKSLSTSTRAWLSCQLNPERPAFSDSLHLQDWRGVAEVLGYQPIQIENFQRSRDPLDEVMRGLPVQLPHCSVGDILSALVMCGRFDVLEDSALERLLDKHHRQTTVASLPLVQYMEQDPEIDSQSDPSNYLTVCEAHTGQLEYFDAYVCFAEADAVFVNRMREVLENMYHLKLCIPERDLLPGLFKQESIARLIKERCTKMLAVLSPEYLKSDECRFLTSLASSLERGLRGRKLVPVVVAECTVPDILQHLSTIDFTRSGVIEWIWSRLAMSLQPPNSVSNFTPGEKCSLLPQIHHPFSKLPSSCRLALAYSKDQDPASPQNSSKIYTPNDQINSNNIVALFENNNNSNLDNRMNNHLDNSNTHEDISGLASSSSLSQSNLDACSLIQSDPLSTYHYSPSNGHVHESSSRSESQLNSAGPSADTSPSSPTCQMPSTCNQQDNKKFKHLPVKSTNQPILNHFSQPQSKKSRVKKLSGDPERNNEVTACKKISGLMGFFNNSKR